MVENYTLTTLFRCREILRQPILPNPGISQPERLSFMGRLERKLERFKTRRPPEEVFGRQQGDLNVRPDFQLGLTLCAIT